jgi:hypothetical protein
LEWIASVPAGAKVTFPSSEIQLGDFEVIDTQDVFDIPDAVNPEVRTWARRMKLESLVTGEGSIPSIENHIKGEDGLQTNLSDAMVIPVVSVLEDRGDPTQFRDIQSVVDIEVPVPRSNAWLWSILGGGAIALCLMVVIGISRRAQTLTPQAWAIQELDELENLIGTNLLTSETFAVAISKTIREYLMMQWSIPETGLTSQELVQDLESGKPFDDETTDELRELFKLSDQAKFAGLQLSPEKCRSVINDSRTIVERIAEGIKMKPQVIDAAEIR